MVRLRIEVFFSQSNSIGYPRPGVFFWGDKYQSCRYTDIPLTEDRTTLGSDPSAVGNSEHGAAKLGAGDVLLASEEEMAKLFPDCELGAEPPFGNMFGMITLMDVGLGKDGYLICPAGAHDRAVRIDLKDYENLVHPRIMEFSYHLH